MPLIHRQRRQHRPHVATEVRVQEPLLLGVELVRRQDGHAGFGSQLRRDEVAEVAVQRRHHLVGARGDRRKLLSGQHPVGATVGHAAGQQLLEPSDPHHEELVQIGRHDALELATLGQEITEGVLLDDAGNVKEGLLASRDAGIQVAIDDFGTGYSSLAYLKKFDIDYLKIDQTFIGNLGHHPDDIALCEAIIVMAHKLGLKVIAEGVETEQQRQLLLDAGCDYAQGFLFSQALPADEFEKLLQTGVPNRLLPHK